VSSDASLRTRYLQRTYFKRLETGELRLERGNLRR
jgi:hypothetical protein